MGRLRRWGPSPGLFPAVQCPAPGWMLAGLYPAPVPEAFGRRLAGPFDLLTRLDRLARWFVFPRDPFFLLLPGGIALLPWVHAWRPRGWALALSLRGSVLWAAAGFAFTIGHL